MKKIIRNSSVWAVCAMLAFSSVPATAAEIDKDWWREAGKPYAGTTIHGVTESTEPGKFARNVLAKDFEKLTGIKVELETTSWGQMYDKAIKDMEAGSGIYDFVYIEQDIVYSYLNRDFLVNLDKMLADNPGMKAPNTDFSKFTTFADYFKDDRGDLFGVPMEAFLKLYVFRKDLFGDPEHKKAFRSKYGHDLKVPKTFEEYRHIAEYFTAAGDGEYWGSTVQAHTGHPASVYEFIESILPSFGVYSWGVNLDNFKSSEADGGALNGDRAKEALKFWISMLDYAPPESTSSTWDEVASTFAAGRAAQGWVYGENIAWIATDSSRSKVVGMVGVSLPPLYEGVLSEVRGGKGYIGYYDGGAYGMPHSSKKKQAALLWLQYIALEVVQPDWAAAASRVTHDSTYSHPKVKELDGKVDGYFSLMQKQGKLFAGAPPFPAHSAMRESIEPHIYSAIIGEISADVALDRAAASLDKKLVELGYSK